MSTLGVIVEYNPFHNGHLFHIQKAKEITHSDAVVAVMSGNFVQRGIPAVVDKWIRTEMALLNGIDLILELPVIYSLSSAEFFSLGSVSLLNSIGIINSICFGSEYGDISTLKTISEVLEEEPTGFKEYLKKFIDTGASYPSARCSALVQYLQDRDAAYAVPLEKIMLSPNNTLGIEYCKSLMRLNSNIKPFTILREGSGYNSDILDDSFSSATALRKYFKENKPLSNLYKYMPHNIMDLLSNLRSQGYNFTFSDYMFSFIKYKLLTTLSPNDLLVIPDIREGLENRIYKYIENINGFDELIEAVKSKRYTYTRISRILCQIFVGFENYDTVSLRKEPCPYARVLGFNKRGKELLNEMKTKSQIPFYTKIPGECNNTMKLDIQATRAYSLINRSVNSDSDYKRHPVIL